MFQHKLILQLSRLTQGVHGAIGFAIVGVVGTLGAAGYFSGRLGQPPGLRGDAFFLLFNAKTFLAGLSLNDISFMGYPDGVSFARFPVFDFTQNAILHVLSSFFSNVFQIWTAFHMTVVAFGFLTTFILFLSLTGNPAQAAVIAFGTQFFSYIDRIGGHNFLFANYAVALGCYLIVYLYARDAIIIARNHFVRFIQTRLLVPFSLITIALSGVYYLFFFLAFVGFLGFVNVLQGRKEVLLPALGVSVAAIAIFFGVSVLAIPDLFFDPIIQSPRRDMMEQGRFGLRVADALLEFGRNPFNTRVVFPSNLVEHYANERALDHGEGMDAFSGPLLTVIVLLSPFLYVLSRGGPVQRWFESDPKWTQLLLNASLAVLFVILFASPWGYGMLFNGLVSPAIRSQNRISVFMNLFGMIMLFGLLRYWFRERSFVLLLVLSAVIGFNGASRYSYWKYYERSVRADSVRQLESANALNALLPASSSTTVLQLPYAGFPEVPDVGGFSPYSHLLLPVTYPQNQPEHMPRWSYGAMTGQISYEMGVQKIGNPVVSGWSHNAVCLGFNHIVIEKRAYAPADLPLPDAALWQKVFEDDVRQLYKQADNARSSVQCATSYHGDYRQRADQRLLFGEDKAWHVDEVGGFLRLNTAQLAIPLDLGNESTTCLHIDAVLLDRAPDAGIKHALYLTVAGQEFRFETSSKAQNISFEVNIPAGARRGSYLMMTASRYGLDMSYWQRFQAWRAAKPIVLGFQTLDVHKSCHDQGKPSLGEAVIR